MGRLRDCERRTWTRWRRSSKTQGARRRFGARSARPRKLGIALAGGGGKGAYQVGVLRALRAAGVRPDVIAGTSVGALNATLLCLDELASQARLREASPDVRRQEVAADLRSDYSRENVSVVHIVPSEPLGNFLTGTMNFNKRKARRLIELGERDAQKALSGVSDLAAWTG